MTKRVIKENAPRYGEAPYRGIQTELKKRIHQGQWAKGAMIPSRRALADEFQVSVPTIQKAISDMVADGVLRVDANRTFVFGDSDPAVNPLPDLDITSTAGSSLGAEIDALRRFNIGIVANFGPGDNAEIASAWPLVIVHEVEHTLSQYGLQSRFFNSQTLQKRLRDTQTPASDQDITKAMVEAILSESPDVLLLYENIRRGSFQPIIDQFAETDVRLVAIGSENYGPRCISVTYDSVTDGYQATRHLIDRGCRRLVFFAPYRVEWTQSRLKGVRLAVEAAGLPHDALQEFVGPDDINFSLSQVQPPGQHRVIARNFAQSRLTPNWDFDGVIAANDDLAIGFIQAAEQVGFRMGEHYAMIAFDDQTETRDLGLSTMHPPFASMGREAAKAVVRILRGQDDLSSIVLKSRLVVRASSTITNALSSGLSQ